MHVIFLPFFFSVVDNVITRERKNDIFFEALQLSKPTNFLGAFVCARILLIGNNIFKCRPSRNIKRRT